MNDRILPKLGLLWATRPHRNLGSVIEQVEDKAFDLILKRYESARLMNLSDRDFERGLDALLADVP